MKNNKILYGAVAVFCVVLLSLGSFNKLGTELSELMIIQGIGIDVTENGYQATLEILNNEQNGMPNGESKSAVTKVYFAEGKSVSEALYKVAKKSGNTPFFAHNRVIILGESTLNGRLEDILGFFVRDLNSRPTQLVCTSKGGSAKELLTSAFYEGDVRSEILEDILLEAYKSTSALRSSVLDIQCRNAEKTSCVTIPAVSVSKNGKQGVYSLVGCAVVKQDNNSVVYLGNKTFEGLCILDGNIEEGGLTAEVENGDLASFRILNGGVKYKIDFTQSGLKYNISIKLLCDLDGIEGEKNYKNDDEFIDTLKEAAQKEIKRKTEKTLQELQKNNMDAARFGRRLLKQSSAKYKEYENSWDEAFPEIEYEIKVDVTLRRLGEEGLSRQREA